MKWVSFLAVWALGACVATAAEQGVPAPVTTAEPPAGPQTEVPAEETSHGLEGYYTVSSIDGEPPRNVISNSRPSITIEADRIHFSSQCIYDDWAWDGELPAIRTSRWTYPETDGLVGMCARGLTDYEKAITASFAGLKTLRQDADGNLFATGGGHRLVLKRLEAPDIGFYGYWRVAEVDGKAADAYPLLLGGNQEQLYWEPSCARQFVEFSITGNDWSAERYDSTGEIVCSIGVPRSLADVWSALEAATRAEWAGENGILISGNGRSVLLEKYEGEAP